MALSAVVKKGDFQWWSKCETVTKASHPLHWKVDKGISELYALNDN